MKTLICARTEVQTEIAALMAPEMLRSVERNFHQLISTAKEKWERKFREPEPSDFCTTVRIHEHANGALTITND